MFGTGKIYGHLLSKIIIIINVVCVPLLHLQTFHSSLPETISAYTQSAIKGQIERRVFFCSVVVQTPDFHFAALWYLQRKLTAPLGSNLPL